MMDSKDKVDIAIRASILARDALDMLHTPNKTIALMGMARIVDRMMDLDRAIKALPEDRP